MKYRTEIPIFLHIFNVQNVNIHSLNFNFYLPMKKQLTFLIIATLILSGCNKTSTVNCTSENAQKLLSQLLIEQVEKKIANEQYSDTGEFIFDKAKIRASLAQLQIAIESIRTIQDDPNSSKKFCSGVLKVIVPSTILTDANQAKELDNKPNISQVARTFDIENTANVFSKKDFNFSVQPTDDGKELFVESENSIWIKMLYNITRTALLKPILEVQKSNKLQQEQQEKQVKQEELTLKAQQIEQERQEIEQLKQETLSSQLKSEKLIALQENQEAERLKKELFEKQIITTLDSSPQKLTVSPSFNCAKASTKTERLICSNNEVAEYDTELAQTYKVAMANAVDKKALKLDQRYWNKNIRDACKDIPCLTYKYALRIKVLSNVE